MRVLALAGALLVAAPLSAQPLRVAVSLGECTERAWSESELRHSLVLELKSDGVLDVSAPDPNVWLEVECDPRQARVTLRVRSSAGAPVTRDMSLVDVPLELQARTVAIGLAELLRGSWFRAEPDKAPTQPSASSDPVPQPASHEPPDAAVKAQSTETPPPGDHASLALELAPALRLYGSEATLLYGGRLAVHAFDVELGAQVFAASLTDPLGQLHYGIATLSAAYDLLRLRAGAFALIGAPRVALGFSWASATDVHPSVLATAPMFDLVWEIAGQFTGALALDSRWSLSLTLAAGYAHGPSYQAESRVMAGLGGAFGEASLGVLWLL